MKQRTCIRKFAFTSRTASADDGSTPRSFVSASEHVTSPKGKSPHPRNCTLSTAICFSHRLDVRSVRSSSINSAIAYVRAPVTCAAVVIRVYTYTLRTSLSGIHSDSYCRRRRCNITVAESILYFASSRDLSSKLFREISTTLMRKHFAILFIYYKHRTQSSLTQD